MLRAAPKSFGDWLRQKREDQGLTQWVLSDRTGCSFSTICKLEQGGRKPSRHMALRLLEVLKIPAAEQAAILEMARSHPNINDIGNVSTASAHERRKLVNPRYRKNVVRRHAHKNNSLPTPRTPFIGREADVAALMSKLSNDNIRIITLLGPPGVGKTRLSLQMARSLDAGAPESVWFVGLSTITDYKMVMPEIAKMLGLSESPRLSALESLKAYLCNKRWLLVLDNFEQVVQAAHEVGDLLDACPHLKIMATSRMALNVYGENLYLMSGLPVPPAEEEMTIERAMGYAAIALFVQRSQAADNAFHLTEENSPVVAEICRRLDGLPLGIELAAARSMLLAPREILSRLSDRFDLLASGPSDLPDRQRSLRGAIDWSYDLLDEDEQRLLRWLSVFAGDTTGDAIEAVTECGMVHDPEDAPHPATKPQNSVQRSILELVMSLLNKSLIHKIETANGEAHYYLLWTIREYAHERLVESGEEYRAKESRARHYLSLGERAEPHLRSGGREQWLRRLDAEHAHILETLTWCKEHEEQIETGLRLAGFLEWYWGHRGYFNEAISRLTGLLEAADQAGMKRESYSRARALSALGRYSLMLFDYGSLRAQLTEAIEIWRIIGDKQGLAYAMTNLGGGMAHGEPSSFKRSKMLVEEAVCLFEEAGDQWGTGYSLSWLADVHEIDHQWETARQIYERALHIFREMGDSWNAAHNLAALGYLALQDANYPRARDYYAEALAVYKAINDRWHTASAQRGLGDVELMEGHLNWAELCYRESLKLYRLHNDRLRTVIMLRSLGYVELQRGQHDSAASLFGESLDALYEIGHEPSVLICLSAFAALAVAKGHLECAAKLSALIQESREELTAAMSAISLAIFDERMAHARSLMGGKAFQSAYDEGRTLTIDQAMKLARSTCG